MTEPHNNKYYQTLSSALLIPFPSQLTWTEKERKREWERVNQLILPSCYSLPFSPPCLSLPTPLCIPYSLLSTLQIPLHILSRDYYYLGTGSTPPASHSLPRDCCSNGSSHVRFLDMLGCWNTWLSNPCFTWICEWNALCMRCQCCYTELWYLMPFSALSENGACIYCKFCLPILSPCYLSLSCMTITIIALVSLVIITTYYFPTVEKGRLFLLWLCWFTSLIYLTCLPFSSVQLALSVSQRRALLSGAQNKHQGKGNSGGRLLVCSIVRLYRQTPS